MGEPEDVYAPPARGLSGLWPLPESGEEVAAYSAGPDWRLVLTDQAVYVARQGEDAGFRFDRVELARHMTLVSATGAQVFVKIAPDPGRTLALSRTAAEAVEEWLGPELPELVRRSVRAMWLWNVVLGAIFVSTTFSGKRGWEEIVWGAIGAGLLGCGAIARLRPAAWVWWLDAALLVALAAVMVAGVFGDQTSYWRLAMALFIAWGAVGRSRLAMHVTGRLRAMR